MTKIFVGNLPTTTTDSSISALFAAHGKVDSVALIIDRETGKPRGFGFIEMPAQDASRAIQSLHGQDFEGRMLKVVEAEERPAQGDKKRGSSRRH